MHPIGHQHDVHNANRAQHQRNHANPAKENVHTVKNLADRILRLHCVPALECIRSDTSMMFPMPIAPSTSVIMPTPPRKLSIPSKLLPTVSCVCTVSQPWNASDRTPA